MSVLNEKSIHLITTTEHPSFSPDSSRSPSLRPQSDTASDPSPSQIPAVDPTSLPADVETSNKSTSVQWTAILFDIVLVFTPLALICKTILCIVASRIDKDTVGAQIDQVHPITLYLIQFNSQLTTLFTIIFVTIVSTFVRRVALWRAQKGASVAELEQWQASISLPSTFKTILSLQLYTVTSLSLVVIWAWYYLGSQASTREYKYQEAGNHLKLRMTVTNPLGPSYLDEQYFSTLSNSQIAGTQALFTNVLAPVGPTTITTPSGWDGTGLMNIPFIDQVDPEAHRDGFFDVYSPSKAKYASYVGVQTYAKFSDLDFLWTSRLIGQLSFNASYLDVDCQPMRARNISDFPTGVMPQMAVSINATVSNNSSHQPISAFEAWYRNESSVGVQAMSAICSVTIVPYQVQAQCNAQGCIAKKLKPIPIADDASRRTVFTNATFVTKFFSEMLLSTGLPSDREDQTYAELAAWPRKDRYTFPNGTKLWRTEIGELTASLPENIEVSAREYGLSVQDMTTYWETSLINHAKGRSRDTLTPMINSYLITYQQNSFAYSAIDAEFSDPNDKYARFDGSVSSPWLSIADLDGTYWNPRYALSIPWIVIDFVSCIVLLLAGVVSAYLRTRIIAPDIFGYVSTMTRDNPNLQLPPTATILTGFERAKLLKKYKVQLADSEANHAIGKVSLMPAGGSSRSTNPNKLSKNRKYI